jgi:cyclopropane-fatty-acyl-phospholipid synthase
VPTTHEVRHYDQITNVENKMTVRPLPKDRSLSKLVPQFTLFDNFCKSILFNKFSQLKHGKLIIEDFSEAQKASYTFGDSDTTLSVKVVIHRSSFYSRTLFGGSIGNAESYIDGDWDTENLSDLVRLFVLNRDILEGIENGMGSFLRPIQKYFHGLRKNTEKGARENIRSHYDIGNDFFKLFLDETMMYSCAFFENKETPLVDASLKKVETILSKLKLKPTDHLIEIGTGWGTLAIYAAKNYGCKVTTTTISSEQYQYALEKVKENKLENQVTVLFEDYRKLQGTYDALVSVEMIEAVGLDHLDTYFEKCSSLLKPNGVMALQAITIRDQFYASAKNSVDFIQRHIFPGSGIPSVHAMMNSLTKKTDLSLIHQEDYSEDYAETLKHWSQRLYKNQDQILKLGYPDFLHRLWQFYFSYCEGGFRERAIGLSQLVFSKPLHREKSFL